MAGPRTRKQAAASPEPKSLGSEIAPSDSGNGSAHVKKDQGPRENIFLFWPNIIGYARIILAVTSLWWMPYHPRSCSLAYSVSCLLDALDGYAARWFNESTQFGAVLDMVTDRCSTACLCTFLASAFPRWAIVFQGLISLDLASHYMHMYASLSGGNTSHKNVDKSRSRILNLYYTNRNVLFITCALNELFFIALYLLSFSSPLLSPSLAQKVPEVVTAPVNSSVLQQLLATSNPYSAGALELARANKIDSFWPWVLVIASFPVMAIKQIINVVQLVKASKQLAEGDLRDRRAKGLPKKKTA